MANILLLDHFKPWKMRQGCSAIVLLLFTGFWGWKRLYPPALPIQTVILKRQAFSRTIVAMGQLEAIHTVNVGTQVSGQLQQIVIKLGEHVEKGQLLATLDPLDAENAVAVAKAKLQAMQAEQQKGVAELGLAKCQQQRLACLRSQQAIPQERVDESNTAVAIRQAENCKIAAAIEQHKIDLKQSQRQLAQTQITAPSAGRIVDIQVEAGQTVVSSQAASVLLTLADLRRMKVRTLISEADVIQLTPGLPANFTLLGDSQRQFTGTILTIGWFPEKTDEAVFYPVIFEVDNPDERLRLSMTAQVSITVEEIKDAVVIPYTALGKKVKDNCYQVELLVKGKPQTREITLGARNEMLLQVIEGLVEGEEIIMRDQPTHAD
jgi:membrane fusion protein, macrolide-specific efflux system